MHLILNYCEGHILDLKESQFCLYCNPLITYNFLTSYNIQCFCLRTCARPSVSLASCTILKERYISSFSKMVAKIRDKTFSKISSIMEMTQWQWVCIFSFLAKKIDIFLRNILHMKFIQNVRLEWLVTRNWEKSNFARKLYSLIKRTFLSWNIKRIHIWMKSKKQSL